MNCLCCGKPLQGPDPSGWHKACIRRFFGTEEFPEIILNDETLTALAEKTAQKGYTVPGVQKKLSLHLSNVEKARLTLVDYPAGYILKPQVPEFPFMPESEYLVMEMASAARLAVASHGLIPMENGYAYVTRRMDRPVSKNGTVKMLAMEDFCQLSERRTEDKYRGSYEQCAKIISRYSSRPGLDLSEFFLRLVFCFLTGNSDMHLKNFSLLETDENSREYCLSPAYDLLPVNILMPEDPEEMALQLFGKKSNLQRKHFLAFAKSIHLPESTANALILSMKKRIPAWLSLCDRSLLPPEMQKALKELILSRSDRL